jgi:hypothetical protein
VAERGVDALNRPVAAPEDHVTRAAPLPPSLVRTAEGRAQVPFSARIAALAAQLAAHPWAAEEACQTAAEYAEW